MIAKFKAIGSLLQKDFISRILGIIMTVEKENNTKSMRFLFQKVR
jgi:hypothetical protein